MFIFNLYKIFFFFIYLYKIFNHHAVHDDKWNAINYNNYKEPSHLVLSALNISLTTSTLYIITLWCGKAFCINDPLWGSSASFDIVVLCSWSFSMVFTQVAKCLGSTSIRHQSNTFASTWASVWSAEHGIGSEIFSHLFFIFLENCCIFSHSVLYNQIIFKLTVTNNANTESSCTL